MLLFLCSCQNHMETLLIHPLQVPNPIIFHQVIAFILHPKYILNPSTSLHLYLHHPRISFLFLIWQLSPYRLVSFLSTWSILHTTVLFMLLEHKHHNKMLLLSVYERLLLLIQSEIFAWDLDPGRSGSCLLLQSHGFPTSLPSFIAAFN